VSRGLFTGQRLEVWRPGVNLLDEELRELGDDVWVGSVVVTSLEGRSRCAGAALRRRGARRRPWCGRARRRAAPVLSLDR
jgi:hypothetical protein